MKKLLRRYMQKLISEGRVSSKEIVILTPKGIDKTSLKKDEQLGGYKLSTLETKELERIRFTSIPKFRGMERQVVILLEFDETIRDLQKNFYLGASRAKTKLIILASNRLNDTLKTSLVDECEQYLGNIMALKGTI